MAKKCVCPICGKESSKYMGHYRKDGLCREHAGDFKNGRLVFCDGSNEYRFVDDDDKCGDQYIELPSEGYSECVICGSKTKGYAFCIECYRKHTEEEMLGILNNKYNGGPNSKFSSDSLSLDNAADLSNNIIVINTDSKSKCITCGKPTDGLLFCGSCYHKYKNKELLFKITNCSSVELLDVDYEGKYTCKDGHIVKSKSERDIDNYLFEHGISHAYEKGLSYGPNEKDVLHPDFCLPNYLGNGKHVYIEHWGYNENNIQYTNTKKFKMPIYKKLGITLVCTHEKSDMSKIEAVLDRKLNKQYIKENQINFEENNN